MTAKRMFFYITVIFFAMGWTENALANGMPYVRSTGAITGNILPTKEERIGIVKEDLRLRVDSNKRELVFNPSMDVHVDVTYHLMNYTSEVIHVPIAFPQNGTPSDWSIFLDSNPIEVKNEMQEIPVKIFRISEDWNRKWINPRSGEQFEFKYHQGSWDQLKAQTFTIPIKPGKHKLDVSYSVRAGVDETQGISPIYRFDYLLSPAEHWRDFKNLTVTVEIPFKHRLYSSLPLNPVDSYNSAAYFEKLPDSNFHLFFSPTAGTWGGLVDTRMGAMLFYTTILAAVILIRRISKPRVSSNSFFLLNIAFSVIVSWGSYVTFSQKVFPYPFTAVQYLLFWAAIGGSLIMLLKSYPSKEG